MDNLLNNGTVLPAGLLGNETHSMMAGFNKTYKNYPLRVGVIIALYPISDSNNHSKLTTEYDVLVIEQNENQTTTPIIYKNCMSSEGMGSIADYFEKTLRVQVKKTNKGTTTLNNQDGAIALLLCLDAMSDKAIIISALTHPDRTTNLTSSSPFLEGEYNGINIVVNTDGSTSLTFKGATDNEGNPIDSSQGNTELQIATDGSFQVNHSTITFRLDKSGTATLTANKDVNVTAQGNITFQIQGNCNINTNGDTNITASGNTVVKASEITLNGSDGEVLTTFTDPVIDLITGVPTQGVPTVKAG